MSANRRQATLLCPSCGRRLVLPAEDWGQLSQCPACREVFTPAVSATAQPLPGQAEGEADTRYQSDDTAAPAEETLVQRWPGRKRRRRGHQAQQPLITPLAKTAFVVVTVLYVVLMLLDPPADRSVGVELLLAPIAGVATAVMVLILQGLFWPGERKLPRGGMFVFCIVGGFLLGPALVLLVGLAAFLAGENKPRWSELAYLLFAAPFLGVLFGLVLFHLGAFVVTVRRVPTILALASQPEDQERRGTDPTERSSEYTRAGDPQNIQRPQ